MEAESWPTKQYRKCCLPQCRGYIYEIYHKFPKKPERCKSWQKALDNPKLNSLPLECLKDKFICSRHFRVKDFRHEQSRKLNFVAVPNLNLKELNELDKCRKTNMKPICKNRAEDNELEQEKIDDILIALEDEMNPIDDNTCNDDNCVSTSPARVEALTSVEALPSVEDPGASATISKNIEEFTESFHLLVKNDVMFITDAVSDLHLIVDILWLRHLCKCSQCFDNTEGRNFKKFFELSSNLQPVLATIIEEIKRLDIEWSDGHASTYNLSELYDKIQTKQQKSIPKYLPWNHQQTQYRDDLQPINFLDLLQTYNNNLICKILNCLQKSGVLVIKHTPKNDSDSLLKRTVMSKLFNHLFDNFTTEKRTNFPAEETTPHTNCTFESLDKGLQILSIPHYKKGTKVKFTLVDGFQVIEQLPKASYEYLKNFKANYSFKDNKGYEHIVQRVVIEEDDADVLKCLWFSPLHLQDIKSADFAKASKHFKILSDSLKMQQNQWLVEADNETIVILDNYRICWCLEKPLENSEIDCLYMERKHYLSSLSVCNKS